MGIRGDLVFPLPLSVFAPTAFFYLPILLPNCANNHTGRHLCLHVRKALSGEGGNFPLGSS